MRCARCGATNPVTATWCNQCLAPFRDEPASAPLDEEPAPAAAAPAPADDPVSALSADAAGAPAAPAERAAAPVRRREDGQVEWDCPGCGLPVVLEHAACEACGTALVARFQPPEPPARSVGLGTGLALTAVLPGAGHLAHGHHGSGAARALLYALWLSGGAVLASAPSSASLAVAVPLLLGALVLWLASMADVLALHAGGRQLVGGRLLLWLVVAVTGMAMVGAVGAVGLVGSGG